MAGYQPTMMDTAALNLRTKGNQLLPGLVDAPSELQYIEPQGERKYTPQHIHDMIARQSGEGMIHSIKGFDDVMQNVRYRRNQGNQLLPNLQRPPTLQGIFQQHAQPQQQQRRPDQLTNMIYGEQQ